MKPRDIVIPIEFSVNLLSGTPTARDFVSCSASGGSAPTLSNCNWEPWGCGQLHCPAGKIQAGFQTSPPFNEDCGGGGNDYDEPSRRLYC